MAGESNATNFIALWQLPESAKLEAQTLDKLSTAPWRLLATGTSLATAPTARLRPLLDDLVTEESYLEMRAVTNQPTEIVLAVRLEAARAALWHTNLAAVIESLTGTKAKLTPGGWTLNPAAAGNATLNPQRSTLNFALARSGNWTLLSVTALRPQRSTLNAQSATPSLLADFQRRLAAGPVPYAARPTNYWLDLDADLLALQSLAINSQPSTLNFLRLTLTVIGDGPNVRTRGELNFPKPVDLPLEPWNIPTNLVHDPLIGFMAVRGLRPWLASLDFWQQQKLGIPPNQVFLWAQDGLPPFHFFALPSAQASNQVYSLSEFALQEINPRIALFPNTTNMPIGAFVRVPDSSLLRWRGLPYIAPNLDLATVGDQTFITGGMFRNTLTNQPAPPELFHQVQADPNLLLYDWEITQKCEYGLIQVFQAGRFVFGRARLSMTNNAALPWLAALSPKLGPAVTSVRLADPQRLTFARSATLGFTGVELHLLAEWLESPNFPQGWFTRDAQPAVPARFPAPHSAPPSGSNP